MKGCNGRELVGDIAVRVFVLIIMTLMMVSIMVVVAVVAVVVLVPEVAALMVRSMP